MADLNPESKIFVAGHRGMVGSAIIRTLEASGFSQILTRTRQDLDLTDQRATRDFFLAERPDCVVFAAARVGGILANSSFPAEFIYQNLSMATSAIHAAYESHCQRFLYLGSTCIYPRHAPQPITEESLLTGPLEPTNEAYAVAKIAGMKLCQHYRKQYGVLFHSAMPTNLYGPGDNYHPDNSHVLPALIRRFHEAERTQQETVTIWGTGKPRREFLHVDDLANAVLHLLSLQDPPDWANVGTGQDISIREAAELVAETVGFQGSLEYDASKSDGTPIKCTDISLLKQTGWSPSIDLRAGLQRTYQDFLSENANDTLRSQ